MLAADAEVDGYVDVGAGQIDLTGTRRSHTVDTYRSTVEGHSDPVGIQGDRRHPDRSKYPPPIGIGSEQRGLDQAVTCHGAGGDESLGLRDRTRDRDGDPLGDAF